MTAVARSFLTGRLPLHHGEMLSEDAGDDMDLRWNLISQKLQPLGYKCHWYGKGHTGYRSMAHLPTSRGFLNFTGFLHGKQSYTSDDRWQNDQPYNGTEYSTELFGEATLSTLAVHDPATPIFLYLPWQAVHDPYDDVPGNPFVPGGKLQLEVSDVSAVNYAGMLWASDCYAGRLRSLLERKQMYDNTLIVYSADNGGRGAGSNYPLRGEKRTNYEGGMRVAAFVSGGLIPPGLRGSSNSIRFHIVDWYATFAYLAGADPRDDPPVPPLPIDPGDPSKDVYQGNASWPGVDGVVIWDMLLRPGQFNLTSAHPILVLSREVILVGSHKLLTSQRGNTGQGEDSFENTWQHPNGSWFSPPGWYQTCGFPVYGNFPHRATMKPCLFDLSTDINETIDLGPEKSEMLEEMWKLLNNSWLGYYHSRSPASMLGPCNPSCTTARWKALSVSNGGGPVCGVPGCDPGPSPLVPPPPPSPSAG